jgi:hypothetical protein
MGFDCVLVKNVTPSAQMALYGRYSPFTSGGSPKISSGDIASIKPSEEHTPDTLAVGSLGSTRQTNTSTATLADATAEDRIKIVPNANEVLLIKRGGIIMADYNGFTIA